MTSPPSTPLSSTNEDEAPTPETFAEFLGSFAYGSRNDLLFKFLKRLPEAEAGEFLRLLLERLGETIDDGDNSRLIDLILEWNVTAYLEAHGSENYAYDEAPFTPLPGALNTMRLGLLTASGHFVEGDDPAPFGEAGMTQEEAIPRIAEFLRSMATLSAIPMETPPEQLRVRHPGYDIRAMKKDPNVGLPLVHLRALLDEGAVGSLAANAYSFVGATAQRPLLKTHASQWAGMMKEQGVNAALLVPA